MMNTIKGIDYLCNVSVYGLYFTNKQSVRVKIGFSTHRRSVLVFYNRSSISFDSIVGLDKCL